MSRPSMDVERLRPLGTLGALIADFDWSTTPLGPPTEWPACLSTVVSVLLGSRFAMWMSWGPELTFLYNDAYARMTLGKKHPWALGKPSCEVWAEIWNDIGPRIEKVLQTGQATWDEALLLFLERSGYREETYHTFSYSALQDEAGKAAGHLCVVTEETDRVIGERRLKTLRSLAAELSKTSTEQDVLESVVRSLNGNQQDLPFTLTYLIDKGTSEAVLACSTGIAAGHPAAPQVIGSTAEPPTWPAANVLAGAQSVLLEDLSSRFGSLPTGVWDLPPRGAVLVPISSQGQGAPAGIFVAASIPTGLTTPNTRALSI